MSIRTKPPSDTYRDGWDRVFGEQQLTPTPEEMIDWAIQGLMDPHAPILPDSWTDLPEFARKARRLLEGKDEAQMGIPDDVYERLRHAYAVAVHLLSECQTTQHSGAGDGEA